MGEASIYQRRLPHYQNPGKSLFITYRLAGSLPRSTLLKLKREREQAQKMITKSSTSKPTELLQQLRRKMFLKWDRLLDAQDTGPKWLEKPQIAQVVAEAIKHRDPEQYRLLCYCVMPNHVHQLIHHFREDLSIYRILASLKRFTATRINAILDRKGQPFWQDESFDHVVRRGKLNTTIDYILQNPVKAGLVKHWSDWPWSWVQPSCDAVS